MKFFKWFFLGLGFWIILIMLITCPINSRAGAVSSVTLSDKAVTFYSPNGREEIYSLNVPFGSTLQDIENSNLIQNSAFLDLTPQYINTNYVNFAPSWYTYYYSNYFVDNIDGGFFLDVSKSSDDNNLIVLQKLEHIQLNTRYYFSCYYNDVFVSGSVLTPSLLPTDAFNSYTIYYSSSFFARFVYISNNTRLGTGWYIDLYFNGTASFDNFTISKPILSLNDDFIYFNSDYLEKLYLNAGYDISNLFWSESPYTSIPFSYDVPIEFNTNLYPSEVTESFSLTDSWQSLLAGLDNNYMTFNTFQDLVETFQDLTDPNNLKADNFIDVFKGLWFLLKSVFVLLYNFFMLIIAPFVDLFAILISALFSGLDFWILI